MTAPQPVDDDPVRAFRQAIGRELDSRLNITMTVVGLIHAAVTHHGWTPKQLAQECGRDLADVVNAGAVVTSRLRKAATHPPVNRLAGFGPARPFCSPECRDNAGWVLDNDRNPTRRCKCRTTEMTA